MSKAEALRMLGAAVERCKEAGFKCGVRPVAWLGRVEVVVEGVELVDGELRVVDIGRSGETAAPQQEANGDE